MSDENNKFLELLKIFDNIDLSKLEIPQHTKECNSYMVGGVSLDHRPPNNRRVWRCSKDCPLKGKE